jgi:triosephosphate isomerase
LEGCSSWFYKLIVNLEVVVAPPSAYLFMTREHLRQGIEVAAQNCFDKPDGAYTGEISVSQLKDLGVTWTILGHSERRQLLCETDTFIASKTKSAIEGGIGVILCVGESLEVHIFYHYINCTDEVKAKRSWSNDRCG